MDEQAIVQLAKDSRKYQEQHQKISERGYDEDFEKDVDSNEDTTIADKNEDTTLTDGERIHHDRTSNTTQDTLGTATTQLHKSSLVYHQSGAYK